MTGDDAQILRPGGVTSSNGAPIRQVTLLDLGSTDPLLSGGDLLDGEVGDDQLYGQGANDRLYGQAGDDFLEGNSGDDLLVGSLGQDDLIGGSAVGNLPDGRDTIYGADAASELSGDEAVILGDNGKITRPLDASGRWQINSFNPAIMRTVELYDVALADGSAVPTELSGGDSIYGQGGRSGLRRGR